MNDEIEVDSDLLPYKILKIGKKGGKRVYYWVINHPAFLNHLVGPFPNRDAAYANMMQWDAEDEAVETPAKIMFDSEVARSSLDRTIEGLVTKMEESDDPAERKKAAMLREKFTYD